MDIIIVGVVAMIGPVIAAPMSSSIAAAVAVFTIVAVVVEVSSSSPTSEHRRYANLHHRFIGTVIVIADAGVRFA